MTRGMVMLGPVAGLFILAFSAMLGCGGGGGGGATGATGATGAAGGVTAAATAATAAGGGTLAPAAPVQWAVTGGPQGGRISALAIDPATPSTVYAGLSEHGGVFKTP